ncbi:MAG: glycosyltransferase family 2 protein [Armatimonadota bacterium]|nr:glycosyltransferase family 2 protein [bacterium]MCS7308974.1 glycosyltransferase family 2 protein [Armatimonadota bacterium]MDW8103680.1 glycosyltransferase family 2 protein [Armatimonadota bacterium]MDW8290185.1 glycosyltransferase family 2 protein [Armatimonadota bacterium]
MNPLQVSVVVPMYNEEENLPELHTRLTRAMSKTGLPVEIVYVDDGSSDDTGEQLNTLLRQPQPVCVRVVQLPYRRGKTAALSAGFSVARGNIVVTTDADMQEPPEVLPMLVAQVQSGAAHLVVAWRQQRQDSPLRVWASRLFNAVLRWLTGVPLHDVNCGTKAMTREVAERLQPWMVSDMHRYLPLIASRMGYRVTEAPVPHVCRRRGRSRFGASRYLRAAVDLLPFSLWWWRGWLVWWSLAGSSLWLTAAGRPVGWLGLILAGAWAGGALLFWLKHGRR